MSVRRAPDGDLNAVGPHQENRVCMDIAQKIVTTLPLQELWSNDGLNAFARGSSLSIADIAEMLRKGRVQFVVAEVGIKLHWISPNDCYDFWKTDVKDHLAIPDSAVQIATFPGEYCYFASVWDCGTIPIPLVLLERCH